MRSFHSILSVLTYASLVLADVKFVTPAAGGVIPAGVAYTVSWAESTTAPLLTALASFQLNLFTGSNTAPTNLGALVSAGTAFPPSNTVSVIIPLAFGGPSAAAVYFLGITSVGTAGGTVVNYSNRFIVSGLTGVLSAVDTAANALAAGTAPPATVNNVVATVPVAAPVAVPAAGNPAFNDPIFAIPYPQQSGVVRYAPMAPVPGSKITAANTSPMWPTSAVPLATAFLPIPVVTTTYTQTQTHSVSSHANTATGSAAPTDDMGRFLARWKD